MLDSVVLIFQSNQMLFFSLVGILGLCVGSFLNVVVYRLPIMLERSWTAITLASDNIKQSRFKTTFNVAVPRSHCPFCKKNISAYHNIPLFSYLFLRGKSACCAQKIPLRYPIIELSSLIISLFLSAHYGASWQFLAALGFSWTLIILFYIDVENKILPDNLTLSLLWAGLLINTAQIFTPIENAIFGAVFGYVFFWIIAFLYHHWRGIEGLGLGDAKLLSACGAWFGWQMLPLIILLSSLLGTVIGIVYLLMRRGNLREAIPFGPFIAIAAFISMIWGQDIVSAYCNLMDVSF